MAAASSRAFPWRLADLRGLSQLGVAATIGVTDLVEQLHATIARGRAPLGAPERRPTTGLTGQVYRSIRGVTRWVGRGLEVTLAALDTAPGDAAAPPDPRREAVLAALNGVLGDRLADTGNPLALPMRLRLDGRPLTLSAAGLAAGVPAPRGRVLVLVHGLAMNDLQWARRGHHHGHHLAREHGYSVLALHYNSGRHVSENGEDFAELLEAALAHWPVPVEELAIVGHSMGGLVARSAIQAAQQRGLAWRRALTRLVCLGTPHHGAALERGGHGLETALGVSPYAAPFRRLGQVRSAGITDLRFGNLLAADRQGRDRGDQRRDDRHPVPLPEGVAVYCVAATTAAQPRGLRHALLGDGLVSLASAWGEHRDPALALRLPDSHKRLITASDHWDLLSHLEVAGWLTRWLGPAARAPGR